MRCALLLEKLCEQIFKSIQYCVQRRSSFSFVDVGHSSSHKSVITSNVYWHTLHSNQDHDLHLEFNLVMFPIYPEDQPATILLFDVDLGVGHLRPLGTMAKTNLYRYSLIRYSAPITTQSVEDPWFTNG